MAFMEPQVTDKQTWIAIDGTQGITYITVEMLDQNRASFLLLSEDAQLATLAAYYEGKPESFKLVKGFGARMSAPGYMDCTEWSVFDTADEAESYLRENYMDEEDEDEEDSIRCDQCEALMIQNTFCHETGCPNSRKTYVPERDAWVLFLNCRVCGCKVEEGENCDCQDDEDEGCDECMTYPCSCDALPEIG